MRKMILALVLLCAGCTTSKPTEHAVAVVYETSILTSMDTTYVLWAGMLDTGTDVAGIIPKKIELQIGDIITIEKRHDDTLWSFRKRINANR